MFGARLPSRRSGGGTLRRLLIASDTLALVLALLVAQVITASTPLRAALDPGGLALLTATLPAWLVGVNLSGLYSRDGRPTRNAIAHERVSLGHLVLIGTAVCLLIALASRSDDHAREGLLIFAVSAVAFLPAGRVATRALAWRWDAFDQTALIVGAGDVGQLVAKKLLRHPEYGIKLVGFCGLASEAVAPDVGGVPVLGASTTCVSIVRARRRPSDRRRSRSRTTRHAGMVRALRKAERSRRCCPTDVRDHRFPRGAAGCRGRSRSSAYRAAPPLSAASE